VTFKDNQGHYNCCCWTGRIWVSLPVKWPVTTSLSSTVSEILSLWLWEIIPKIFWEELCHHTSWQKMDSPAASAGCAMPTINGLPQDTLISNELHVLSTGLYTGKRTSPGQQIWSVFYLLTVRMSSGLHFTNGQDIQEVIPTPLYHLTVTSGCCRLTC